MKPVKIPLIQSLIIELRGERVILDSDLAMLYQVPTKALNQAVRRNISRFPRDFMFQLNKEEWRYLRSQFVTANMERSKVRTRPYVFSQNGANMVCAVLKSPIAVQRSIQIMRAFSALERIISKTKKKPLDLNIINQLSTHSKAIMHLFQKDKLTSGQIGKIGLIQEQMIGLLQQIVSASLAYKQHAE